MLHDDEDDDDAEIYFIGQCWLRTPSQELLYRGQGVLIHQMPSTM